MKKFVVLLMKEKQPGMNDKNDDSDFNKWSMKALVLGF